ncbi:MAG TPA: hypothetical protein VMZ73_09130 [Acidimicrobiales bacterium]|nr:hypothetical protein [Acidimicrobiales bacterium]
MSSTRRGYGAAYRQARAELLAGSPPCHWCGKPATTADHDPPLESAGYHHLSLVPACESCNYGRRNRLLRPHASPPSRAW